MRIRTQHLALLSLVLAQQSVAWWYPANIIESDIRIVLGQMLKTEFVSFLSCVQQATSTPWANLFCHEDHRCLLSNALVDGIPDGSSTHCWTTKVPPRCFYPFVDVPGVGCIYLFMILLTWQDARLHCKSYGADLTTPKDFDAFEKHFRDNLYYAETWVGVKNKKWLTGANVTHWAVNEPTGTASEECGKMTSIFWDPFQIYDFPCATLLYSICELRI